MCNNNEILYNLKSPANKYKPIPFWSWNDKVKIEETKWQIN